MRGMVVGIAVLVLGASVVQAEARFRGRIGGHATPARSALAAMPGLAVIPGLTLRRDDAHAASPDGTAAVKPASVVTAEALAPGEAGSLKIPTIAPAPTTAPVAKKPDEPWCRSGRVAGSGAGFCLIN